MDTYSVFKYKSIHFPINQKWNVDRIGFLMDTNYKVSLLRTFIAS